MMQFSRTWTVLEKERFSEMAIEKCWNLVWELLKCPKIDTT